MQQTTESHFGPASLVGRRSLISHSLGTECGAVHLSVTSTVCIIIVGYDKHMPRTAQRQLADEHASQTGPSDRAAGGRAH